MQSDSSTDEFRSAVARGLFESLEAEPGTVYAIDRDGRIVYVNPAWYTFAAANGGDSNALHIGASLWSVIPDVLEPFYEAGLDGAFASEAPWLHEYECSSDTTRRHFRMRVLPLVSTAFAIVANDLIREGLHADPSCADSRRYLNGAGIVTQCAHCRRVCREDDAIRRWEWVPELVRSPTRGVSHGLCDPCVEYHYPEPHNASESPESMSPGATILVATAASVVKGSVSQEPT